MPAYGGVASVRVVKTNSASDEGAASDGGDELMVRRLFIVTRSIIYYLLLWYIRLLAQLDYSEAGSWRGKLHSTGLE